MVEILLWSSMFIGTLVVLIYASDYFIEAAESIGLSMGIPSFIIGVTIVALGTSIPELASSIVAVQRDSSEIVVSNVVGSNITNIFLVLGVVVLITKRRTLIMASATTDVLLLVGSAILLIIASLDGVFLWYEALFCLVGLVLYMLGQYRNFKKQEMTDVVNPPFQWKNILVLALAIVAIYFAAEYNIESIIQLSAILGIGKEYIALSAVALGTSLPELFVSVGAIRKGKLEIAVGNLLGSNILNVLVVMGIPGLMSALVIPDIVLSYGLFLMVVATFMLFLLLWRKRLPLWSGFVLLALYGYFFYVLISQNMAAA